MATAHFRRLDGLQHLRAVAALGVVLFHASARFGLHSAIGPWGVDGWRLGERGVDVFFVLSGFLLWTVAAHRPQPPGPFLWSRIKRIGPPYWIATLALAAAALFTPLYPHLVIRPLNLLASLAFWPVASINHPPAVWPLLVPGWTLNYEMAFYALFAAVLFVPRARLCVLAAAIGALVLIGRLPTLPDPLRFWTQPIIVEFLFGVLVGVVYVGGRRHGPTVASALVLLGTLGLIFLPFAGYRLWVSGLPAAALVWGLATLDDARRWPPLPALRRVGDASYSIFLWHTLGITAAYPLVLRAGLGGVPGTLACAVAGGLLGALAYLLIEKPIAARLSARKVPHAP